MVRPDWTPNLWAFRQRGVWFGRSHCVFPSVTRVNSAALATGSFPGTHGLAGNSVWRPDTEPSRRLNTGEIEDLLLLQRRHGRLLSIPTMAEALAARGMRCVSVGTGSSGGAFLMQPEAAQHGGLAYHHQFSEPPELAEKIAAALGPPPPARGSSDALAMSRVEYAARALTDVLIPNSDPALAAFWITLPDGAHHRHGLGAAESLTAIRGVDAVFGRLMQSLAGRAPNVIVTADHGYATVSAHVDVAAELVRAGIKAAPDSSDVVVCADGGAALLYAEDAVNLERLAAFLLTQPWTGAVFARDGVAGSLPLSLVGCDGPNAPSVLAAMAWQDRANQHGIRGLSWGQGGIAVGAGDHGGLSPFEMRNTLIAAGPAFREGIRSEAPCGIVDIAPTVLRCLGVERPSGWDGRVLTEALREDGRDPAAGHDEVSASFSGGRQVLTLARADGVSYPAFGTLMRDD
jgi:arylsulfatase A-like enzyme